MKKPHPEKTKATLKEQLREGMLFLAIIVTVIAYFIIAAVKGFDPAEQFVAVAGTLALFLLVVAGVVLAFALLVGVLRLLLSGSKR